MLAKSFPLDLGEIRNWDNTKWLFDCWFEMTVEGRFDHNFEEIPQLAADKEVAVIRSSTAVKILSYYKTWNIKLVDQILKLRIVRQTQQE